MKKVINKIERAIISTVIKIFCLIFFRVKVEGVENIPKDGSVIFCGNHKSYLDPVIIVVFASRELSFMAKEELKENLLFKFLFHVYGVIYVKRDAKDISALKEALKRLKDNECIGIFPEGTRNGLEKNNGEMKDGAAYMALKTGAKLLPIGVSGSGKMFQKNKLVYGKPIDVTEYQTKDKELEKENKEKLTQILKEEIIKLTK